MHALALAGQVALVTGANTGIGRVTAVHLARQGAHVFLACRSQQKTQPVLDEIHRLGLGRAEFLELDLGDLASVQRCADQFLQRQLPLHLLINNAGLAGKKGLSASGFELAFGVCHVGHFLLTTRLLDVLKASAPARVVVVSSRAHTRAPAFDLERVREPTASRTGIPEYCTAKLANVLFSSELARRLAGSGVNSYALHPGVVASDVWRELPWPARMLLRPFMLTSEQGAQTTLYCATSAQCATESGLYYDQSQVKRPSRAASDTDLARRLWAASEAWVAPT